MSYKLSFGLHKGETFEWVFFNDPGYAAFIYDNRIHRQEHNMDEEEGEYFLELYRRSGSLTGICSQCQKRPITRMGLSWQQGNKLGMVGHYCSECEYVGGSATAYHPSGFTIEAHRLSKVEQKRIIKEIKRVWLGVSGKPTQAAMERFFRTDANFADGTAGFFTNLPKAD